MAAVSARINTAAGSRTLRAPNRPAQQRPFLRSRRAPAMVRAIASQQRPEGGVMEDLRAFATYFAEAAAAAFRPAVSDVDWTGTTTPFTGRIVHHGEGRHPQLSFVTVEQDLHTVPVNWSSDDDDAAPAASLRASLAETVARAAGQNVQGSSEPDWSSLRTSGYGGDKVRRQRDVRRVLRW